MRVKKVLAAALVAPTVFLAACSSDDGAGSEATSQESSSSAEEGAGGEAAAEPDLDGVPDVVAEVNGEEISKDEFVPAYEQQFQQMAAQSQMTGQQPDQDELKKQVADQLVNTELLEQAAAERGIEASEKQVDRTLADLAKSNQMGSADEFISALKEQGMSEDEVLSQVAVQVKLDQLLEKESGGVKITDAELRKAYDQLKSQSKQTGQKAPSFQKSRSQLEEQVKSEKLNGVAQTLLKDLRKDAEISVNV
ncbi:SurA N-terminal domain-containing protein [Nocardioides panacisoli]|uniref:SurA N-terminal domain-containing protein n=1 Tax=Nocardioides panacisoli TaxID=627624 RepID=UPI001C6364CB|nr:SurA N-terminal domain-containing protein [Nocardioides panacisoli]QYJ05634.1 SurA N-terminal domain-containing protein [Nocardioides panacisoli]